MPSGSESLNIRRTIKGGLNVARRHLLSIICEGSMLVILIRRRIRSKK